MSKTQHIQFKEVKDLVSCLPESKRKVTLAFKIIIQECSPGATKRKSSNVPAKGMMTGFCKASLIREEKVGYLGKRESIAGIYEDIRFLYRN